MKHLLTIAVFLVIGVATVAVMYKTSPIDASSLGALTLNNFQTFLRKPIRSYPTVLPPATTPTSTATSTPDRRRAVTPPPAPATTSTTAFNCTVRQNLVRNCDVDQYADDANIVSACVVSKSAWVFCDQGSCAVAFYQDKNGLRYTGVGSVKMDVNGRPIAKPPSKCEYY